MKIKMVFGMGPSTNHVFLDGVEVTSAIQRVNFSAGWDGLPSVILETIYDELIVDVEVRDVLRRVPKMEDESPKVLPDLPLKTLVNSMVTVREFADILGVKRGVTRA
jgi:hypothetical protein